MQEIFEHNIQEQFSDFKIEPSTQTWLEIEKALYPNKEKRKFFWWWALLAGVIVAGLITWKFYNSKPSALHNNFPISTQKKIINEKKKDTIQQSAINTALGSSEKCVKKNGYCTVTHNSVIINSHVQKTKVIHQIPFVKVNSNKKEITINNNNIVASNNYILKKETGNTVESTVTASNSNVVIKKEENKNGSILKKVDSVSSSIKQAANSTKNKNTKKSKWFIAGEASLLSINNNIFPHFAKSSQYISSPSNNIGSGLSSPTIYTTTPDKGFGFSLGIYRQTQLSRHWHFETGFVYRYFQNKQSVGSKKDTTSQQFNLSGNYYYQAGQSTGVINYAHNIEVPLLIKYIIYPKPKNNFYLQAGIEAGYTFAKKWMITDEAQNMYYYKNSLINNIQLNTTFGIGINFHNKFQTNINFTQAITPLYKINNNKIYTNQISLQVFIPVSLKNKK